MWSREYHQCHQKKFVLQHFLHPIYYHLSKAHYNSDIRRNKFINTYKKTAPLKGTKYRNER